MRARGLWVTAGSWAAANETDGKIPRHVIRTLGGNTKDAAALVEAGLWREAKAGWVFHEWGIYQPDAASLKAKRKAEVEGGIWGNHRRWHLGKNVQVPGCAYCDGMPPEDESEPPEYDRVPDRGPDGVPESGASRPVPEPEPDPKSTQVGGGGNLSSDEPEPPPPTSILEPWRCANHQGIDTPCLACKTAKANHKASEEQRIKDEREQREAETARLLAEREAKLDAAEEARRAALAATQSGRMSE
jgi:hypothetical protein